jgi:LPPG:FO 2-phospho-L-lactate transferase
MLTVLSGGTGGAKLVEGLSAVLEPAELTIICNTGDDARFHGLYVSPDIDTLIYTLAGLIDGEKGWGLEADSFVALEELRRLGEDAWFRLGDRDLATHILRTKWLDEGIGLAQIVERICRARGVKAKLLPMSDDRVETRIMTPQGEIPFQEFFVKRRALPEVLAVRFAGAAESRPAPGVIEAIRDAEGIILCPSNPVTSIGPILAVPGVRAALKESAGRTVAISPIIGGAAISGPAHKLMRALGEETSVVGVAYAYRDFLDALLISEEDRAEVARIERLAIEAICTDIRMASAVEKHRLAREVLACLKK